MSELIPNAYDAHRIIIIWTVGDSLTVEFEDLEVWEAQAALQQAMDLISEDENHDADVAED